MVPVKLLLLISLLVNGSICHVITKGVHGEEESCETKRCHKLLDSNKINVHLIPHSHDDVGWLKTVEEYYYGRNNSIQNAGVRYIIDSVLQALKRDSKRRYIQVETAYFWEWWTNQSEDKRNLFKSFVDNGQIEMVGGGWTMNDEACTNYQSIINQFTLGLRLLNDTLGACGRPKIGWQIDPFGHSREQASIFKQMGFNAFFFVRLSQSDKDQRSVEQNLEFMWKSSEELDDIEIFTSIFPTNSYFAPSGFCWDYLQCNSDAIIDDPESFEYNLDQKVADFSEAIATYSAYYRSNNILFGMGGDFQYQAADMNYLNIDRLIKGFENNENYNVFYSTPSCYYQAVMNAKPNLTVTTEDFFPFAESNHIYWAGYYTSRPTTKRFERTGNNILQASQQLNAFAKMRNQLNADDYESNLKILREAVGTMQHHDAITGTEKQHVANDYVRMLTKAINDAEKSTSIIISNLLKKDNVTEDITLPLSTCLLTNISICENSMKDTFMVTVYNPLSRYVTYYVRLPSQNSSYTITGPDGEESYDIINNMDYRINSTTPSSKVDLLFTARNIPPMGLKFYYIQKLTDTFNAIDKFEETDNKTFGTASVSFTLDTNNLLETVTMNNKTININQKFMGYISNNGSGDYIRSGAYLFRPRNGTDAYNIDYSNETRLNDTNQKEISYTSYRGSLVDEVYQVFNDWLTQTIRVYKGDDSNFIEFDWIVGPLDNKTVDTEYKEGKEVITRFYATELSNEFFYTDSNGRELLKRERSKYPYDDLTVEPVASNYYPVTSKIVIQNDTQDLRVAILNDRSQGGSSLWEGEIELMVHRRLLRDDSKGVAETLEEMEFGNYLVVRGQHYLVVGSSAATSNDKNTKSTSAQERELALKKLLQPWVLVGDATSDEWSLENLQASISFEWSGLKSALPDNVHILNLEPWKDGSYILRIEHVFAKGEDEIYSQNTTIDISEIFSPYIITSLRETRLAANDWLSDTESLDSLKWKTDSAHPYTSFSKSSRETSSTEISLSPMQIRTFIIEVTKSF